MSESKPLETRDLYSHFSRITTRWKDNDIHGHVNNAVYNDWMDTTVSHYFRQICPSGFSGSPSFPITAHTRITFKRPITHPAQVETGIRIDRMDDQSVFSKIGIFLQGEPEAAAWGHMEHVWIDRKSSKPVQIPDDFRESVELARSRDSQ